MVDTNLYIRKLNQYNTKLNSRIAYSKVFKKYNYLTNYQSHKAYLWLLVKIFFYKYR